MDTDQLKAIPILEVAQRLGIETKQSGNAAHKISDPSFSFSIAKNFFNDFGGTGAKGSTIDLVMHEQGCGEKEACDWLRREFSGVTAAPVAVKKEMASKPFEGAMWWGERKKELLKHEAEARAYLAGRGIDFLKVKESIGFEMLGGRFPKLAVALKDEHGKIIGGKHRKIASDDIDNSNKSLFLSGEKTGASSKGLFYEKNDLEAQQIYVVAGEMDWLAAKCIGVAAVGVASESFSLPYLSIFKGKNVTVLFDNDDAGRKHAEPVAQAILAAGAKTTGFAKPNTAKDLNEILQQNPGLTAENLGEHITVVMTTKPAQDETKIIAKLATPEQQEYQSKTTTATKKKMPLGVNEKEGFYYKTQVTRDGDLKEVRLSNFLVKVLFSKIDEEGNLLRVCEFNTQRGHPVRIEIAGQDFANVGDFSKAIASKGDLFFHGQTADLKLLCEMIFGEEPKVKELSYLGANTNGVWALGGEVYAKGKLIAKDDEGFYTVGDQKFSFDTRKTSGLKLNILEDTDGKITPKNVAKLVELYTSDRVTTAFVIGWLTYAITSSYWWEHKEFTGGAPIMWIHGESEIGKTEFVQLLLTLIGRPKEAKPFTFKGSTAKGFAAAMRHFRDIPFFADEFNPEYWYSSGARDVNLEQIKSIGYNRQTPGVSNTRREFVSSEINAPLLLASESFPNDKNVSNRTISINFTREMRGAEAVWQKWLNTADEMGNWLLNMLRKITPEVLAATARNASEWRKYLEENTGAVDRRTVKIYAMVIACAELAEVEIDEQLKKKIAEAVKARTMEIEEKSFTVRWFEAVDYIASSSRRKDTMTGEWESTIDWRDYVRILDDGSVAIAMGKLYDLYEDKSKQKMLAQGGKASCKKNIMAHFGDKCFEKTQQKFGKANIPAVVFTVAALKNCPALENFVALTADYEIKKEISQEVISETEKMARELFKA